MNAVTQVSLQDATNMLTEAFTSGKFTVYFMPNPSVSRDVSFSDLGLVTGDNIFTITHHTGIRSVTGRLRRC